MKLSRSIDIIIDGERYMPIWDDRVTAHICKIIQQYTKEVLETEPPLNLADYSGQEYNTAIDMNNYY